MADNLRLAVGIIGNVATILLYGAPILTFAGVIRKRSVGDFSCFPYTAALLNCVVYAWYGLPVVSRRWENFVLVPINGLGVLLELTFLFIYFKFASRDGKKNVVVLTTAVIILFTSTALLSVFAIQDHGHRKVLVGSVGLIASASMYGSPLVVLKQVIRTKSVEFMPFYLSLFTFLSSSLWMTFGLLSHDLFVAAPNMVGCPLGILQLMLYCKYRKTILAAEEKPKLDYVNNDEESNNVAIIKSQNLVYVDEEKKNIEADQKIDQKLPFHDAKKMIDQDKPMQLVVVPNGNANGHGHGHVCI